MGRKNKADVGGEQDIEPCVEQSCEQGDEQDIEPCVEQSCEQGVEQCVEPCGEQCDIEQGGEQDIEQIKPAVREMHRRELLGRLCELADESVKNLYSEVFDKSGESRGFRYDTSVAGIVLKTIELSAKLSGIGADAGQDGGKNELHVIFDGDTERLAR